MNFRIVLLTDSIHTQCFAEIADSVEWALKELGHSVQRGATVAAVMDTTNIVFGLRPDNCALFELGAVPTNTIIYNGEQVTTQSIFPALAKVYKNFTIWDYSVANSKRYPVFGLKEPRVVRPGHCPLLEGRVPADVEKDSDVVFFGSKNARRQQLLDDLRAADMSVLEVPFGLYGAERDAYLARARIAVNVHFYEDSIFESVRCSYLMHNGIPVVSEASAEREEAKWSLSENVAYDQMVDACRLALRNCHLEGPLQLEGVRAISLLDDVRAALESGGEQGLAVSSDVAGSANASSDGVQEVVFKPTITLCMIVKNEAEIIQRCLASVAPHITGYSIVDTGSTDGTQERIRSFMSERGIPGDVHDCTWKEFDGSRTEAMELGSKFCGGEGWLMLIDADEFLVVEGGRLQVPLDGFDCYNSWISRCIGCTRWARPFLARANKSWFYEMPRHEGLFSRGHAPSRMEPLDGTLVLSMTDGARATESSYDRFLRDAQTLEKWGMSRHNHTRCAFYTAQSYRDAATGKTPPDRPALQKALMFYLKRVQQGGGFDMEVFEAMYQAGIAMNNLNYPLVRVQQQLLEAYNFRPSRAEPLYHLAQYYRESKQWALAAMFARTASQIPPTQDWFQGVQQDVYTWRAREELAVALTWLGQYQEAFEINASILARDDLSQDDRARVVENQATCMRMLGKT